jgi:nucleoporin NUP82
MGRVLERDGVAAVVAVVMELRLEKLKLAAHGPTRARRASFTARTFVCARTAPTLSPHRLCHHYLRTFTLRLSPREPVPTMPKVLSYTPDWLARPSPGYQLFAPKQSPANSAAAKKKDYGPRKTIATRGSEIFVAAGNEIRWADLANLKEGIEPAYRTLRISIPLPITRLVISPQEDYLAVSTSHTVHVVHLPDSSLLEDNDDSPLKPKAFQVGPTAHVTEESPIATTLWHPLGYHGRCLVTITKAGVVRLWEVNRADRSTFSEPALSIDLPKLANATNDQEDLTASKFGASKGFSPDSVELEVASACFGDFPEQEGVHGWAPMTLWIATVPGDVYALCPLLPSKWQLVDCPATYTLLQTLSSSINVNYADLQDDDDGPQDELKNLERQVSWVSDILYNEPFLEELPNGDSIKVFARPSSTPAVPLLQGPFDIAPEVDDFELSDMIVYSLKTFSEGSEEETAEGLPTAVVCLLTDTCKVHVCLDLQGIVGRWLPSSEVRFGSSQARPYTNEYQDEAEVTDAPEHNLIIVETVTLVQGEASSFSQSITPDVHTDFSFFVSHATGVFYVSLEPWVRKLETELSQPQLEGAEFRIQRLLDAANSSVERYIERKPTGDLAEQDVTSSVVIEDGNIGYLLLTSVDDQPQAAFLDAPESGGATDEEIAEYMHIAAPQTEVREAWQPPRELYEPIDLLDAINIPSRHRAAMKEEVKLSPANLELLMDVHRVLSVKTSRLQKAVSDLFNRATRMQEEFRDQILRTALITSQIDAVTGNDEPGSDDGSAYGSTKIDERLQKVRARQDKINSRYESLRSKMNKLSSSELSEKEANYVDELSTMDSAVDKTNTTLTSDVDGSAPAWKRLEKLQEVRKTLALEAEDASKEAAKTAPARNENVRVPTHSRKLENEQIQEYLARLTVLVEAAAQRVRDQGIAIPAEEA